MVADFQGELTYDAVRSLAITRTVEEKDAVKNSFLFFPNVAPLAIVVVPDKVSQIFHRQLRVSNHKLSVIGVEGYGEVEEISAL